MRGLAPPPALLSSLWASIVGVSSRILRKGVDESESGEERTTGKKGAAQSSSSFIPSSPSLFSFPPPHLLGNADQLLGLGILAVHACCCLEKRSIEEECRRTRRYLAGTLFPPLSFPPLLSLSPLSSFPFSPICGWLLMSSRAGVRPLSRLNASSHTRSCLLNTSTLLSAISWRESERRVRRERERERERGG